MKTVLKYQAQDTKQYLPPQRKAVLAGRDHNGEICVWYEVEARAVPTQYVALSVQGTGFTFPDNFVHVGSFVDDPSFGPFVWHIYEEVLT